MWLNKDSTKYKLEKASKTDSTVVQRVGYFATVFLFVQSYPIYKCKQVNSRHVDPYAFYSPGQNSIHSQRSIGPLWGAMI